MIELNFGFEPFPNWERSVGAHLAVLRQVETEPESVQRDLREPYRKGDEVYSS